MQDVHPEKPEERRQALQDPHGIEHNDLSPEMLLHAVQQQQFSNYNISGIGESVDLGVEAVAGGSFISGCFTGGSLQDGLLADS